MKRIVVPILVACLLSPSLLPGAHAQTAAGGIDHIRASIAALEKLERGGAVAGEVESLNHEFLTNKRKQLRAALQRREVALQEYLLIAGASLSEAEVQAVKASLGGVRREVRSLDALIPGEGSAGGESVTVRSLRQAEPAPVVSAGWVRAAADASAGTSAAVELAPQGGVANACPGCLPYPQMDESKDFIISARTGETRGKTRFGRTERARIIVVDKNPFLYEYRVTLKAIPIVESAIPAFFGGFQLFAEQLNPKTDEEQKETKAVKESDLSCPTLDTVKKVEALLAAEDSSVDENSLRKLYTTNQVEYGRIAAQFKTAQDVLRSPNASCSTLCGTATGIRATLQNYKPGLQELGDRITVFKARAVFLQAEVNQLQGLDLDPGCAGLLDRYRTLAAGYMKTAETFEKGLATITAGKKTFDEAVKTINNVFANPNAFYQVYTRGPFGTPTDLEVTVERRSLLEESAKFAKVSETETLNFGGGARFAIAGGVVASPFETVTYKRVPAIVGGRATTIIGEENSSNSRILPILMLHGRLFDMPDSSYFSGLHFSLGVTAKPNDEGTNVEWLIGPSVSFAGERLFLTVGGYAGRRQQLQGNLTPGQELPEEFKDDIPINNRLVWKPGFALTYRFK